jgi:hypothetical protein
MRSITGPELAIIQGAHFEVHARLSLRDDSAGEVDFTDIASMSATGGDLLKATVSGTIDAPLLTAEFAVHRGRGTDQLAPLLASSSVNALGPRLRPFVTVKLETACVAPGTTPVSGDWKEVFFGLVDDVDSASDPDAILLSCRDFWAIALDMWNMENHTFGLPGGQPLADAVLDVLQAESRFPGVAIEVVGTPTFQLKTYPTDPGSKLELMRILVQQSGWDLRGRYNSSGEWALTLYEPDRALTVGSLVTFTPSQYLAIPRAVQSLADVRNYWEVAYYDTATSTVEIKTAENGTSITLYGFRPARIAEDAQQGIDTGTEAQAYADAILADTSEPPLDLELQTLYFWPVELNDVHTYEANDTVFDANQVLAVLAYQHTLEGGHGTTTFTTRGAPATQYRRWIAQEGGPARLTHVSTNDPPATGTFREGALWLVVDTVDRVGLP